MKFSSRAPYARFIPMTSPLMTGSHITLALTETNSPTHDLASGRKFTYSQMNDRTSRLRGCATTSSKFNGDRVAVSQRTTPTSLRFNSPAGSWELSLSHSIGGYRYPSWSTSWVTQADVIIHDDAFEDNATKLAELCAIGHRVA